MIIGKKIRTVVWFLFLIFFVYGLGLIFQDLFRDPDYVSSFRDVDKKSVEICEHLFYQSGREYLYNYFTDSFLSHLKSEECRDERYCPASWDPQEFIADYFDGEPYLYKKQWIGNRLSTEHFIVTVVRQPYFNNIDPFLCTLALVRADAWKNSKRRTKTYLESFFSLRTKRWSVWGYDTDGPNKRELDRLISEYGQSNKALNVDTAEQFVNRYNNYLPELKKMYDADVYGEVSDQHKAAINYINKYHSVFYKK